jgi:dynein heavy chain
VFKGLLSDLFPGIDIPRQRNWDNEKVISEVCIENGLQPDDNCLLKIVQLDELLGIRHSIFLMGPSGMLG